MPSNLLLAAALAVSAWAAQTHVFDPAKGPVPAHRHPNGGGWVADSATVSPDSFVGPDASVFDAATVDQRSYVEGTASVHGLGTVRHAFVRGRGEVFENGLADEGTVVEGRGRIFGEAKVHGAYVGESSKVHGSAIVQRIGYGLPVLLGEADVRDQAGVQGSCWLGGLAKVSGQARLFGSDVYGDGQVGGSARLHGSLVEGSGLVDGDAELDCKVVAGGHVGAGRGDGLPASPACPAP